jgi:hypothetical protein
LNLMGINFELRFKLKSKLIFNEMTKNTFFLNTINFLTFFLKKNLN